MDREYKRWEDLTFADDFMFSKVMSNKEICKGLIERLLHIEVSQIEIISEQKTITTTYDSKGIRLDVYVKDTDRVIDIEMQTVNRGDLATRSRYYQSLMDVDSLQKGQGYNELKESYVLFLCMFDPFKLGYPLYTFKKTCCENQNLTLDDKTINVFYNSKGAKNERDKEVAAFLEYLTDGQPRTDFLVKIEREVLEVKRNLMWRKEYMTLEMIEQEIREAALAKGRKQGLEEGIEQGREEGLEKGLKATAVKCKEIGLPLEQIAQITGLPLETIKQL